MYETELKPTFQEYVSQYLSCFVQPPKVSEFGCPELF